MVPKGGLEPPHPCEYMDLNHARLPIPPLRHACERSVLHLNREPLVCQTAPLLSIEAAWPYTEFDPHGLQQTGLMKAATMPDSTKPLPAAPSLEKIPEELALEVRKLAHDLSNALEIIVQTSYLLSTVELKEPATDWLKMLDGGVEKALGINLELREYIKRHTSR